MFVTQDGQHQCKAQAVVLLWHKVTTVSWPSCHEQIYSFL